MDIIRKYKLYLEKVSNSSESIKNIEDLPEEVKETSLQIIKDMFERVKKPTFEIHSNYGIVIKFDVTENDFRFTDENEKLELDISEGSKRKRTYDVVLVPVDLKDFKVSETFSLMYEIQYELRTKIDIEHDEDDEDVVVEDDWEKPEEDYGIDDDELERGLQKGKVPSEENFISLEDEDEF
jgi:hypothetical protein